MSTDALPRPPAHPQETPGAGLKAAVKADVLQSSPRLRLWQMLRDEYQLFHQELPPVALEADFWSLKEEQLKFPQIALRLRELDDAASRECFKELDETSRNELRSFESDEPLSPKLRRDILEALNKVLADDDFYDNYDERIVCQILSEAETGIEYAHLKGNPLSANQLPQVNRWLIEETFPDEIVSIDENLTVKYYQAIHQQNHSALCLSGGGIRSATFNLGLLQGLARHGLLEKFEYLSTVSGGGFSGGWLSAWIERHPEGVDGVVRELGKQSSSAPTRPKPLEPEPEPFTWLRSYSNFLSPKLGLFSADTWTLVATLLRNIFLNWLVFVPVFMAALVLPRLWVAFLSRRTFAGAGEAEGWSLLIGFVAGMLGLLYIGLNLPSTRLRNSRQRDFLLLCLLPLTISSMALATYWWRLAGQANRPGLRDFVFYQITVISVPWFVCAVYQFYVRRSTSKRFRLFLHFILATILIFTAQAITALLMWKAATSWRGSIFLYACVAVPLILGLLAFTGVLLAGLTSHYTDDEDQEWWARAGAWIFIVMIGWSVICALVIYGPALLVNLPGELAAGHIFSKEMLTTIGGVVSGVIALYGGFTSKVPANENEAKRAGLGATILRLLVSASAVVFLGFLIIVLALLTNWLMVHLLAGLDAFANWRPSAWGYFLFGSLPPVAKWFTAGEALPGPFEHLELIGASPLRLLLLVIAILSLLGYLCGRLINTNRFSLHYLWRNRIIRAYLGASNPNRRPNRFTGFDSDDNLQMYELKPKKKKLFHVLNFALNLVGGEKLAWQERKAESFTASPLHCGNYRLGYRRSEVYGKRLKAGDCARRHGISLGTSIAISGAFVSPNMGYMQSSPVVRFLMTLFNVRFGWWLGNPGRAGEGKLRTYDRDSPRLSVKPIVQEALGMTNDRSDYVYLSDGGHFENFGLYEMVLRRCRLIVVGDATSDAEYAFESLGQSLRKIRIDFGIPIEFKRFLIAKPARDKKGVYAALGTIRYSCIDGKASPQAAPQVQADAHLKDANDGTLILIKPTLTGEEYQDILNYASQSGSFPQEFIGDQWFSESQFESYRALGSHIIDALCREHKQEINDWEILDLDEFEKRINANLNPTLEPDFGDKVLEYLKQNIS